MKFYYIFPNGDPSSIILDKKSILLNSVEVTLGPFWQTYFEIGSVISDKI